MQQNVEKKYYYADEQTANLLMSDERRVYLYGSCVGYNNFGDIIQLKNAIAFHKKETQITPVIIMHISSLEHPKHVQELKKWYSCDNFIFLSDEIVDASSVSLYPIQKITSNGILHMYGGGFLNKYWGKGIIEKISDIIETLFISEYVFSGQQVEDATIPYLNTLFEKKKPIMFGVRDRESYENMKMSSSIVENVFFSFDDVTEIFQAWKDSAKPNLKLRVINKLRPSSVLWHINISDYATANKLAVLSKIRRVKREYPRNRMLIAHVYNDIRVSLRDSLQSVIQLENDFPYYDYKVVNLAQMALDMHPEDHNYPNIANLFSNVNLAIASSYHTAMLTTYFGIPSYLMSENEFYSQKQKGLRFESDFDKFLQNPSINLHTYDSEVAERKVWLEKLSVMVRKISHQEDGDLIALQKDVVAEDAPKLAYRNANS